MTDPYQAAAQSIGQGNPPAVDTTGNLHDSFAGETSQLFGTDGVAMPPSLLNKTHPLGTERTGTISAPPFDVHSTTFGTPSERQKKYWADSPLPDGKKITTSPTDHVTGKPLRPVKDTIIPLSTTYRFTPVECAAVNRDPALEDDGTRGFYASGADLKALRAEIGRLGLRSEQEMVSLTLTVKRTAQKPNPGGNPSWINTVTLSR